MYFFIGFSVSLWFVAAIVLSSQIVRIWSLDFATVGTMTIAQVYHASRRGLIVVFVALVVLSWPLWLEINCWDRAIFRDGKLVRVIESGTVMSQRTWDRITSEDSVFVLMHGAEGYTKVDIQCPGYASQDLIVTIDCKNGRDDVLKRLEFSSKAGIKKDQSGYVQPIVKQVIGESPKFDELCRTAKKLSIEENGDGTSYLKAKRELFEIAEKISEDLWSRLSIRIIDVDFR